MTEADQFIHAAVKDIPSLPTANAAMPPKSNATAAVAGVGVGTLAYLAAPEIANIPAEGLKDEFIGAAAGVAAFLAFSVVAPRLCHSPQEQRSIEKWNISKGAASGTLTGAGATMTISGIMSWITFDLVTSLGIISLFTAAGTGAVWLYNGISKKKYCVNPRCRKKDSCKNIVCRECMFLHIPMETPLDCERSIGLTWYQVASQLRNDGLSYPESLKLARECFDAWRPHKDAKGELATIECEQFKEWRSNNKKSIAAYANSGARLLPEDEEYLLKLEKEQAKRFS